jgi:outer membrane protein OmpA-like peptidoglycan-associated protein
MGFPFGDRGRPLMHSEAALIRRVFKTAQLPRLSEIRIRNGASTTGTAITIPLDGLYNIMVGEPKSRFFGDLSVTDRDMLVHEMTHVWQYFHGTLSRTHGMTAHIHRWAAGKLGYPDEDYLYEYNMLTDSWNDMGFEGQAQLVEEWFHDGMGGEDKDKRFCFIDKVLYKGSVDARAMNIIQLCDGDFYDAPSPDPEPIRITQKDDSFVVILNGDVLFDFGKSDIKPEAGKALDAAAAKIKSIWRNGSVILVNGYTDDIGSDGFNNRLSDRRAQAVAYSFLSRGLPYSVMRPQGFGKANPVASNANPAGRAKNRRVEIFVARS